MKDLILVRRSAAPLGAAFGSALLPATEKDDAALAKIPMGETVALKLVRGRSLPQMRLFWALLDKVATASRFENAERLLVALKIRLGRYDLCAMPSGKAVPVPHSISFAAMEHGDFTKFFDDSVRLICTEVVPGTDAGALVREVEEMLGTPPQSIEHELAPPPQPATTERPHGPDDALEEAEQRQGGPGSMRGADAGSSTSPLRLDYRIEPDYDVYNQTVVWPAWFRPLLIPKLRAAKTRRDFADRIAANADLIANYKKTLEPSALVAAMKELDDIEKALG